MRLREAKGEEGSEENRGKENEREREREKKKGTKGESGRLMALGKKGRESLGLLVLGGQEGQVSEASVR